MCQTCERTADTHWEPPFAMTSGTGFSVKATDCTDFCAQWQPASLTNKSVRVPEINAAECNASFCLVLCPSMHLTHQWKLDKWGNRSGWAEATL